MKHPRNPRIDTPPIGSPIDYWLQFWLDWAEGWASPRRHAMVEELRSLESAAMRQWWFDAMAGAK